MEKENEMCFTLRSGSVLPRSSYTHRPCAHHHTLIHIRKRILNNICFYLYFLCVALFILDDKNSMTVWLNAKWDVYVSLIAVHKIVHITI